MARICIPDHEYKERVQRCAAILRREKLEFETDGSSRTPHASIRMLPRDWSRVLSGELHVMAIILAGRAPFPKDQRRLLMQFSMLLQTTVLSKGPDRE